MENSRSRCQEIFGCYLERFISACDYFFEQKNKATSSQRSVEQENLEKKKAIIEKLTAIDETMDVEEATQLVRELMKEWNGIGHVPFKEKDKIYKQYHSRIDKLFEHFNISASNKKLSNFNRPSAVSRKAARKPFIVNGTNWYAPAKT